MTKSTRIFLSLTEKQWAVKVEKEEKEETFQKRRQERVFY